MNLRLRALNRFGLGARVGEQALVTDPRTWLKQQLQPAAALLQTPELPDLHQIIEVLRSQRQRRLDQNREGLRQGRKSSREFFENEAIAALERRVTTDKPFLERLISFWSNHLCVSIQEKFAVLPLAGHYERTVIRPHVLGRFVDMVLASARHPAMLVYLDNVRSIGPRSPAARLASRQGQERGLNENYARELLELHTLGVQGGYTQGDVEQLALILTGWSLAGIAPRMRASRRVGFHFNESLHEPGEKALMGVRYPAAGRQEGEKAIRDICAREATAQFLSRKLVQHFVADEPPASAVAKIAQVFSRTGGDLLQVSLALVDLEEAWNPENRKFRTPQDWLAASLRALEIKRFPPVLAEILRSLRQPLWAPPAPKGFGDTLQEWGDPDSLMNRAELAQTLADRLTDQISDPFQLAQTMDSGESSTTLKKLKEESIPAAQRIALALAGPAFQWR